jgi:hypothetical protein
MSADAHAQRGWMPTIEAPSTPSPIVRLFAWGDDRLAGAWLSVNGTR